MWSSVVPNSQGQYQIGWNHYLQYLVHFGTNILMTVIPTEFRVMQRDQQWSYSFPETVFLGYLNYLRVQVQVLPQTAFSYMSAVRFMLKCHNMDTSFLDNSQCIRSTRSGMMLTYRMSDGNTEAEGRTMPMTTDMVQFGVNTMFNDGTFISRAIRTALVTAFCLLMRICEYIVVKKSDHHLLGESVIFGIRESLIQSIRFITSDTAHLYDTSLVCQVIVTVRSAKNDKFGLGHRFCFQRGESSMPNDQAFDITKILFEWAQVARPSSKQPFFSWKIGNKINTLSRNQIDKAIKSIASKYGFPTKRWTSKSLRIGGASVLAAAQVPDYTIKMMGRWKSLIFLEYIRLSTLAFNKAVAIMSNISTFTSTDLMQISSSATLLTQRGIESDSSQS